MRARWTIRVQALWGRKSHLPRRVGTGTSGYGLARRVDYAPLIDMVRPGRYVHEHRYLGVTAEVWLAQVRAKGVVEYAAR